MVLSDTLTVTVPDATSPAFWKSVVLKPLTFTVCGVPSVESTRKPRPV